MGKFLRHNRIIGWGPHWVAVCGYGADLRNQSGRVDGRDSSLRNSNHRSLLFSVIRLGRDERAVGID